MINTNNDLVIVIGGANGIGIACAVGALKDYKFVISDYNYKVVDDSVSKLLVVHINVVGFTCHIADIESENSLKVSISYQGPFPDMVHTTSIRDEGGSSETVLAHDPTGRDIIANTFYSIAKAGSTGILFSSMPGQTLLPFDVCGCTLQHQQRRYVHQKKVSSNENTAALMCNSTAGGVRFICSKSRIQMKHFDQKATEKIRTNFDESPLINTSIEQGNIESTILDLVVNHEIDYVIMGTQGKRSTLTKYLGNTASSLVKHASCSVIVIPEQAVLESTIKLGYTTDFSEIATSELHKALELFKPFQLETECVHFNEKHTNDTQQIKDFKSYFDEFVPALNNQAYTSNFSHEMKFD